MATVVKATLLLLALQIWALKSLPSLHLILSPLAKIKPTKQKIKLTKPRKPKLKPKNLTQISLGDFYFSVENDWV